MEAPLSPAELNNEAWGGHEHLPWHYVIGISVLLAIGSYNEDMACPRCLEALVRSCLDSNVYFNWLLTGL